LNVSAQSVFKSAYLRVIPHGRFDQADLINYTALGLRNLSYPRLRPRVFLFLEKDGTASCPDAPAPTPVCIISATVCSKP
jgi:hypothetical protein